MTGPMRALRALLLALSGIAMVMAFGSVGLGIVSRLIGWNVPGLDGYAGYAIAGAFFLALPATFQRGEHIRATLPLQRLGPRGQTALEIWSLIAGLAISIYLAVYAVRLVWQSHRFHDIAATADATPLWIPQIAMAVGCIGFALSFVEALVARLRKQSWFTEAADEAARAE